MLGLLLFAVMLLITTVMRSFFFLLVYPLFYFSFFLAIVMFFCLIMIRLMGLTLLLVPLIHLLVCLCSCKLYVYEGTLGVELKHINCDGPPIHVESLLVDLFIAE